MPFHSLTTDLEDLFNEIRIEIDNVSDRVIEYYLQRAIIEFCEKSHWWQEDVGPLTVISGVTNYEFSAGKYTQIVTLEKVGTLDDSGERVWLESSEDSSLSAWNFWPDSPFSFDAYPNESLSGRQLNVICSLKPKLAGGTFKVSESLVQEYRDPLIAGAKSKILAVPNKEWTDYPLSQKLESDFKDHCSAAMRHAAQGFSRVPRGITHKERLFY